MAYKLDNDKGSKLIDKLDFVSLMIALLFGTAALPHVLIRYYTVPDPASARKSTIVAIAGIGFFYILTIYMGLGAMINGVIDVTNSNMSAPLLAKSFGIGIFSIISAIAFATGWLAPFSLSRISFQPIWGIFKPLVLGSIGLTVPSIQPSP